MKELLGYLLACICFYCVYLGFTGHQKFKPDNDHLESHDNIDDK